MSTDSIHRPNTRELTFQLVDRPIHPEFIVDRMASRVFERDGYRLELHLTTAGHLIQWSCQDRAWLVEVLGDGKQPVPDNRDLFVHRIGGERSELYSPAEGVTYRTCFAIERMPEAVYFQMDAELRDESRRSGVLQLLSTTDRLGVTPLSFVDLQARTNSLIIHTYHTFPEDYAIVKSQTLIDIDG
jgi:hypothetical protein